MQTPEQMTLIGAGLAGSLLAVYLAQRGFGVEVFEGRPDMRTTRISAGRSINMALSTRGIHALREVGVLGTVMQQAIPMRGRMIHDLSGELTFLPYGQDEREVIYSISRADLNIALMNAAEQHHVTLHFSHRCEGLDLDGRRLLLSKNGKSVQTGFARLIGTDGAGSAVRSEFLKRPRFDYSQHYLAHGYKELSIPSGPNNTFRIEKNALHIWPRGTYMLIALPNPDGSFTCTLFLPYEGENSFASLQTAADVQRFFESQFPDAVPLLTDLAGEFFANPTGALATVKCTPWFIEDKVLLVGDAAHAIVPFYGQGMNCAFEDCTVLNQCIEEGSDWQQIFADYQQRRKANADAIADLALDNFIEMRDRVADETFHLKKHIELALERRFPDYFIPKYSMVTFHRIPYALALERGKRQERILDDLAAGIEDVAALDWQRAEKLLRKELGPFPQQKVF